MRRLVSAAAVLVVSSTIAFAADMPVKARAVAPAMYNWSGFYVGGDAGWQSSAVGLSSPDPGNNLTYSPHHNSFALGAFAGYQHQFGQLVLGVEGGYTAGFGNVSLGVTPSISIFANGGTGTAQAKMKNIWTAGGRIGWAVGPVGEWLPYITGGYAAGSFGFDAQETAGRTETATASLNGGYIGAGIDWAPKALFGQNVILGLEYRHYAFSSKTVTGSISSGASENVAFDPKTDAIVGRISFKFGN